MPAVRRADNCCVELEGNKNRNSLASPPYAKASGDTPSSTSLRVTVRWPATRSPKGVGWRREGDSNPRYGFTPYNGLANRRFQPLSHPSILWNNLLYRFSPFLSIKPSLKSLGKNDLPIILSKILNKIQKRTRNKKITRYIEILSFKSLREEIPATNSGRKAWKKGSC